MAKTKRTEKKCKERETQALYEQVMKCRPIISRDDMGKLETLMNGNGTLAVARRIGLAQAIQDGEFYKRVSEDRDLAICVAGQLEAIESSAKAYHEVAEMMSSAAMRARVALCNYADMEQVYKEAGEHAVIVPASS